MNYFPLSGKQDSLSDIEKLNRNSWAYMSISKKQSLIVKMFTSYISDHCYLEATLFFVNEDNDSQMHGSNGYYNHADRMICINESLLLLDQGLMVYSVLCHELVHVEQNYMVDHIDEFPDKREEIELLNIYLNGIDRKINFCDMKDVNANFHITNFGTYSEITNLFYYLNVSEREAYKKQSITYEESNRFYFSYERFNYIYKTNLNKQQIEDLIDLCFLNLFNQNIPLGTYEEQNLQATVMYDIASVSHYMYEYMHSEFMMHEPYIIDRQLKRISLAKYGYTIYNEDPVNDLMKIASSYIVGDKEIKDLTLEQQKVNPKLLLLCINFGKMTIDDIKDKESFIYELRKMYNSLSSDLQNYIDTNIVNIFNKDKEIKEWN